MLCEYGNEYIQNLNKDYIKLVCRLIYKHSKYNIKLILTFPLSMEESWTHII